MRDPDLFGRIDRVLHECDARQLPPLNPTPQPTAEDAATLERFWTAALEERNRICDSGPRPGLRSWIGTWANIFRR